MIELTVESTGLNSHYDLTDRIAAALQEHGTGDGLAGVFAHGSTIGLAVMRYEPGAVQDLLRALERIAPESPADGSRYLHELTTADPNGFSHLKSSLLGTSLLVPFRDGRLAMSPSHRVVLFDFDLKPATRRVFIDAPRIGATSAHDTDVTTNVKENSR
ncbi:YjbQ family protein [Streptomyces sp. HNM0663]|uniref:YjbQ family protein n=1 Tax=Streptomyces chengmaiensis TaxID=3040919 RepID=A0ABT6HJL0_9ACTN|nr:YjbQ family protein [Streptomyces chengmaiensis]MDH2388927.1 YjbQ family protein [Streptomyces chengmaiensis]